MDTALSPVPRLAVVLVRPRNPLNIGAVARAMSNFGFTDLRIAGAHRPNVEAARSAVDAGPLLDSAKVYDTLAEAIADCTHILGTTTGKARSLQQPMHDLPAAAAMLPADERCALLFGSEKHGLTSDDLSFCHALWHIPTRAAHLSMNLGQAAAICLFAIATRATPALLPEEPAQSTSQQRELLHQAMLELLATTGYAGAEDSAVLAQKTRRMLSNAVLTQEDAQLLLGMLRRIDGKLRKTGS